MADADHVQAARGFLHSVPLDAFVDERKRIVRELRAAKDKAGAAEVAKLRKPSAPAWALNRVAREAPGVVEEWLASGAALRQASSNPAAAGGDAVRAAIHAHREATRRLMEVVRAQGWPADRPLSDSMLDRVQALLRSATTDPDTGELLRGGQISEEGAAPGETASLGLEGREGAETGRQAPGSKRRTSGTAGRSHPPADPQDETERPELTASEVRRRRARDAKRAEVVARLERRIRDAEAEVVAVRAERERRAAAAEEADERADAARRDLRRAESEADAAHEAARELDRPLADAADDLERLRADLRSQADQDTA